MKNVSTLLIVLQLSPAFGVQSSIQLVRVGNFSTKNAIRTTQVEKGVQRSIENSASLKSKVSLNDYPLRNFEYEEFKSVLEINRLIQKLKTSILLDEDEQTLNRVRAKFEKLGRYGKEIQQSYIVEAYSNWKRGERTTADKLLSKAVRLHPEGEGDFLGDWAEADAADNGSLSFSLFLETKRSKVNRGCEIQFTDLEKDQRPYVNGFQLDLKKRYHFHSGQVYRLSRGPEYETSLITCGHAKMRVALSSKREMGNTFETVSRKGRVILFLREVNGQIGMDAYSDGGKFQKDFFRWGRQASEKYVLPEEKISELARYHQIGVFDLAMNPMLRPNPQPPVAVLTEDLETPWYKSWVFWTIAGVVAAGTTTYLLTRNQDNSTVGTNSSGIKISLE